MGGAGGGRVSLRLAGAVAVLALAGVACGSDGPAAPRRPAAAEATPASPSTDAATLRASLTTLLTEHVHLVALSTGAALRGDTQGFDAYASALNGPTDSNSADLTAAVTAVYGAGAGMTFDDLWRGEGHIGGLFAYAQAVGAGDKAAADKAVAGLLAHAKAFGAAMNSVNSNLPAAAVEASFRTHVTLLTAVVDAQRAGDAAKAAASLRAGVAHMSETALVLSDATVKRFPEKF